jgi:hypothetical protein
MLVRRNIVEDISVKKEEMIGSSGVSAGQWMRVLEKRRSRLRGREEGI